MSLLDIRSFAAGEWIAPDSSARMIASAVTGEPMARAGSALPVQDMLDYARNVGGRALRGMRHQDVLEQPPAHKPGVARRQRQRVQHQRRGGRVGHRRL